MALRDRQIGKVSTALLLAIIALPLSLAAFVMLYADWNLTVPTTKDQTTEFWADLLICAVLPLICASAVFVVRDFVRRRSGKQVVAVISLLVPTALLMGIALSPRFLHVWRMQLTARTWHWRHGSSTRVGHYEVPVPVHCFATDIPYGVQMECAASREFNRSKIPASFTLLVSETGRDIDLEYWKSVQRSFGAKEELTLNLSGESMLCFSNPTPLPRAAMMGLDCASNRGLSVLYFGPQSLVPAFSAITSQIRR